MVNYSDPRKLYQIFVLYFPNFPKMPIRNSSFWSILLLTIFLLSACQNSSSESTSVLDLAANEDVANYIQQFEGRGDQADDSQPTAPEAALKQFQYPPDLALDLLAAEPLIHQPVELNFDHRGRLWVVQYSQYPYPAGLRITGYDYHLRAQFDKVPEPPPQGVKGADKITLLEDTDGDGRMDKATDAITGLNIATSVTWGRGQIWVLNPPYLLAFPDTDGDGIPNGDPVVHLTGFGLEDTHAVANSLRWGPDGWLYGAQGSTTIANIHSAATDTVHFKGQAIWRYHPDTEEFEIYAEGGGNTFHVEIDDKGRIYSGHNGGNSRGQYYKQGSYYQKNWGKHGALTNPYAFGFFPHMDLEGENLRFTHAWLRYGGGTLPEKYHDKLIGINPLHNFVQLSRFEPQGSSFSVVDEDRILQTGDHWFRPVDIKSGPDGSIYLADWYDGRLSHIDPRDTWHRSSGRIYRLRNADAQPQSYPDLGTFTHDQLLELLNHDNKWFRQQALRQFGDRKDESFIPDLTSLIEKEIGQIALEALWALNLSGGFNEEIAKESLTHPNPFVRMWTVRLLGDGKKVSVSMANMLADRAKTEPHPEVRSQFAATAKRLPGIHSLNILKALVQRNEDVRDPHLPLQIWWALEAQAETSREEVLALFEDHHFWNKAIVKETLLSRLAQRYIMAGGAANFAACSQLLELAPESDYAQAIMAGIWEGLRGKSMAELPADLLAAMDKHAIQAGEDRWSLGLRRGDSTVLKSVLERVANSDGKLAERLYYVQLLGESDHPTSVPILLDIVGNSASSGALKRQALRALRRYDVPAIGERVLAWYPDRLRADPDVRAAAQELLVSRPAWAKLLLAAITQSKRIAASDLPLARVQDLMLVLDDSESEQVHQLWPESEVGQFRGKSPTNRTLEKGHWAKIRKSRLPEKSSSNSVVGLVTKCREKVEPLGRT